MFQVISAWLFILVFCFTWWVSLYHYPLITLFCTFIVPILVWLMFTMVFDELKDFRVDGVLEDEEEIG